MGNSPGTKFLGYSNALALWIEELNRSSCTHDQLEDATFNLILVGVPVLLFFVREADEYLLSRQKVHNGCSRSRYLF